MPKRLVSIWIGGRERSGTPKPVVYRIQLECHWPRHWSRFAHPECGNWFRASCGATAATNCGLGRIDQTMRDIIVERLV